MNDTEKHSTRRLVHVERIPIRWGDMDPLGHVNNIMYFRYMEQARIGMFETLVSAERRWKDVGMVIVNAACEFRRALTYPGTVAVSVYIEPPGGSSLKTIYEMRVDGDEKPYAEGSAVVVFINPATQKPIRIPEDIRAQLEEVKP